jgi:Leucine-rich repeat (LRR) protein
MRGHVSFKTFVALSATSHRIDLENMSLHSIPFDLSLAVEVYRLSLENNLILELPNDWTPLVNLVELRLGCNNIQRLPAGLSVLSTLLGLYVQNNRLTQIPSALTSLVRLRRMDVHGNSIEAIGIEFGRFWGQLELSIDLENLIYPPADQLNKTGQSRCEILELLDAWWQSRITRALVLTHRNIRDFPAISEWTTSEYLHLTSIDFSHNCIQVIPSWIDCISDLKFLNLKENPICTISRKIAFVLPNLVQLDVDWANVEHNPGLPWIENGWCAIKKWWTELEESTSELQLTSLDLAGSNLHEVGLICGSRLQSLRINNCQVASVSPHWSLLTNLSTLEIEMNALSDLQSEPFQSMHLLNSCTIVNCSVDRISEGFFVSKWSLTILNLSCNKLSMLPDSIGLATALTNINLDKNRLDSLPDTWTSLHSIEACSIKKNILSGELDVLFMHLSKLKYLNLSQNRLDHFPLNPRHQTNLRSLNVSYNSITCLKHCNFQLWVELIKFKVNENLLDFTGNPMSLLPETCRKDAASMLTLLKMRLSIIRTHEIVAEHCWDRDTLDFLLSRSDSCIVTATFQNLGLFQHPMAIFLHVHVVVLDMSNNCIETISRNLSDLASLKSLNLSHNLIRECHVDDVGLCLEYAN